MTLTNPADWQTYDTLALGIDTNRLPQTAALAGRELRVDTEADGRLTLRFGDDGTVAWERSGGEAASAGQDPVDVVEVDARGVYFVDFWHRSVDERTATTLILDLARGRTLTVRSVVRDAAVDGEPRVAQTFSAGVVDGMDAMGVVPGPTRDLIGKRILNDYSPNHLYEHFYVNSGRYAWQCLRGVQKGHGDMDLATYWKFDEGRYLFAFREFRIPVASVFFFNMDTLRSTGKFVGLEGNGELNNNYAGATIAVLSETRYPDGVEPV